MVDLLEKIKKFVKKLFNVNIETFLDAIAVNPSAQGYIGGAISELLLKSELEEIGYEVLRIKEKPRGGYNAKIAEARGDFYIRKKGVKEDKWLVIESKGLKSNSEFRGSKLDSKEKLFRFLKPLAFPPKKQKNITYYKGLKRYENTKQKWQRQNPAKKFPPFRWDKKTPGPNNADLRGLWNDENDLISWIKKQPDDSFEEKAYRKVKGPIAILETHSPSKREAPITGIKQAAPLVTDFNIMAVDLFLRKGKHDFAFMNAEAISHSPTSPEHLYQNYTIDILVKGKKDKVCLSPPWYSDLEECIITTKPKPRKLDKTQLDERDIEYFNI